ncbi:hypothetical protein EV191_105103 [Tamaricihabitans halophyticus]|uniref:Uncharacterized protein n=1 Tax=Tamaricihabitans halophyticus TaxID=1262583 RepID=A0A4R2R0R9_9PSEU|nr:hypothetical protein [Tamaricihabitans halophyticus]TCP53041.1 hypothetical protein EV191_105103 [Tamaricihabitans halophyticus]
MSEPDEQPTVDRARAAARAELDKVFGEVLPQASSDERAPEPAESNPDAWYLDNRPPHHDR